MRLQLAEEILDPDRPRDLPLSQAERKALLERLRKTEPLVEENRALKDKLPALRKNFVATRRVYSHARRLRPNCRGGKHSLE